MRAAAAGTNEPIWASTAISAFWRRKVLLPAMLGPVTSQMRAAVPRSQSLGTKGASPPAPTASTTGWRPPSISKAVVSSTTGRV